MTNALRRDKTLQILNWIFCIQNLSMKWYYGFTILMRLPWHERQRLEFIADCIIIRRNKRSKTVYKTEKTLYNKERTATIEDLIPPTHEGGRPCSADVREISNAIFYILRAGYAWRLLPRDLPPWRTVYGYFRRFSKDGTWDKIRVYWKPC